MHNYDERYNSTFVLLFLAVVLRSVNLYVCASPLLYLRYQILIFIRVIYKTNSRPNGPNYNKGENALLSEKEQNRRRIPR